MTALRHEPFDQVADAARLALLAERAQLIDALELSAGASAPVRSDVPDGSGETEHLVAAEQLMVSARLDTLTRATLDEIDAALLRLDDGSYGICTACGEPIASERLEAVPAAAMCMPCQQDHERHSR
jgi:RNA polymerase-binding transcription factor DksA